MKMAFRLVAAFAIVGTTFLAACWADSYNHNTSIRVHDTPDKYEFEMQYEKPRTLAITQYLDSCFTGEKPIDWNSSIERQIILKDATTFNLQSTDGQLHILMNKATNRSSSIARMRKICSQIRFVNNTK